MRLTDLSDVELLDRVRSGYADAFAELWTRHWQPVLATAHRYRSLCDPEDLAQEAFLRVHQSLLGGGGPFHSFRPYVYRTVRNLAISMSRVTQAEPVGSAADLGDRLDIEDDVEQDPSAQILDVSITVRAFNKLPSRWQEVLWYTVVEGLKPREVAPLLGLSPNAVSALTVRAREGLRQEWLRAHTRSDGIPAECRAVVDQLPELARGTLAKRREAEVRDHLDTCLHCSLIRREIDDLARSLRTVLPPLLLVPAGGALTLFGDLRPEPGAEPGAAVSEPAPTPRRASRGGGGRAQAVPTAAKIAGVVSGITLAVLGGRALLAPGPQEPSQLRVGPAAPSGAPESLSQMPAPEPTSEEESGRAPTGVPGPPEADADLTAGGPSVAGGIDDENGTDEMDDAADGGARPDGEDPTEPDGGEGPGDTAGTLLIMGPELGSYTLVPEITGVGTPGTEVTLLDVSGNFLGLTSVAADGSWAITPAGLEAGSVEFVAVTGNSVSETLGPYELLAPDLVLTTLGADVPATETASDGSTVAMVGGRIRGVSGQAARIELDGDRVSPWYQFGSRAFTVQFTTSVGRHTLTARYVDPATGRVGAARTVALTVSVPGTSR